MVRKHTHQAAPQRQSIKMFKILSIVPSCKKQKGG